ncbi:MAG: hypothetical protein H6964_13790 [Chromatiaceae bacterium]|nr:hypothetical protein [Gammaproteobacteria bacterium]MCP5448048.1 hypothetical protein [Chromatiaceae bacterium]
MNRNSEHEIDDDMEEWEPFLHHRNRAHRKTGSERRHFDYDESGHNPEKRKRKVRRTPEVFD